ncbi:hypothetical protein BOTBODRAFT_53289 [Botryobasidium botryosum FD-172 SS1]|uniref:Small ribosomal subunit protein mS23 n=1 Tax=Botryobasidium botryosum (strain FD-172 SS1) TaxID=930990 RepID=A0A067MST9_BOTB1|nr:hypothetical protein BOTBODRAFT_53289 [Botryobasidium botryosum FD-172 SS1]
MPRRIASQVHQSTSRLLKAAYIPKTPAWYQAVLAYPPIPLPPRSTPHRTSYDLPAPPSSSTHHHAHHTPQKHLRTPKPTIPKIEYLEDKIRLQFFKDHPFETFRPRSLIEGAEIVQPSIKGKEWTRLRQRGRNPTTEDVIDFAATLHQEHNQPLSEAYKTAVMQFRALRAEFAISSAVARQEAQAYGAQFAPNELERGFMNEEKALDTFVGDAGKGLESMGGKLPWTVVWEGPDRESKEWTRGAAYTRRMEAGERPDYSKEEEVAPPVEVVDTSDPFLGKMLELPS